MTAVNGRVHARRARQGCRSAIQAIRSFSDGEHLIDLDIQREGPLANAEQLRLEGRAGVKR